MDIALRVFYGGVGVRWHGGLEKCGPNMGLQLGHLEFFHLGILTHCVLSPWGLGVCGGLCGGGMCYTWKPGDHIEYSGGARVANYTRVSILLHKIYMAVCKRVAKTPFHNTVYL